MALFVNNAAQAAVPLGEYTELVSTLRDSLRENRIVPGGRAASWAKDLALCHKHECGGDAARLRRVLSWYCKHVKGKGVPIAESASGFRKKFYRIEAAMGKDQKAAPPDQISKAAHDAFRFAAANVGFPPGFKVLAPGYAQKCIDQITPLRSRVEEFVTRRKAELAKQKRTHSRDTSLVYACERLLAEFGSPQQFAQRFLEDIGRQLRGWKDHSGNYSHLLLDPKHDEGYFFRRLCSAVGEYGMDTVFRIKKEVMGL